MNNNSQVKYQPKAKYTSKIIKNTKSKQYQPAPGKSNMSKWEANDQQWGGQKGQMITNANQMSLNKKKINLNGLVDRMMGSSSNQFEAKIMEDWMKSMNAKVNTNK